MSRWCVETVTRGTKLTITVRQLEADEVSLASGETYYFYFDGKGYCYYDAFPEKYADLGEKDLRTIDVCPENSLAVEYAKRLFAGSMFSEAALNI